MVYAGNSNKKALQHCLISCRQKTLAAGVALALGVAALPSQAGFVQTSPSNTQTTTIAASTCRQQLDTEIIALHSAAYIADAAGLAAEAVGAAWVVSEIPGIVAQGVALTMDIAAYAFEEDVANQLPYCEETFAGSVVVTNGGVSVTGDSIFNNNLDVSGALGVNGSATLSGGATISNGATISGGTTMNGGATVNGNTTMNGSATITNGASISGGATVNGGATLNGGTTMNNGATVNGGITVNGGASISGGVTLSSGAGGTGNRVIADGTSARMVSADGSDFVAVSTATGVTMNGNGATAALNGTNASLLNSTGHGLTVTATQTTLSGGTNSSTWTMMDGQATLGVGTAVEPEVILVNATNSGGGITNATIGTAAAGNTNNLVGGVNNIGTGTENTQNNIGNLATSANNVSGVTNAIAASTTNTITAGTNNVITATSGSNTISSAAGANQVVTNAAGAATGTAIQGTGTTAGVTLAGTSGGQTAILALGRDNRYGTGSPVANFSSSGGAPIRVTGVADGVYDYDAVNMRQFSTTVGDLGAALRDTGKLAYSGIASVAAMAGIPDPAPGKRYNFGLGVGQYEGYRAVAAGFKGHVTDNVSVTAGAAFGSYSNTYNAGVGFSW